MSGRTFRFRATDWDLPVDDPEEGEEEEEEEEEEESLYFAICEDDQVGLMRMLKEGLNPNFKFNGANQLGKTVLHLCCEKGLIGCAKLLIAEGAKVNACDCWCQTPLMYAICTERPEMVRTMVDAGVDVNMRDRFGESVLHYTVKHETTECMQILLEVDAYIDMPDNLDRTPLWNAAAKDGYEVPLKYLLEYGADVTQKDCREKQTPLQAALAHTSKDTVTYMHHLLRAGAPVDVIDELGHTCVMTLLRRCSMNNKDFTDEDKQKVHILLEAGHDIDQICDVIKPALWYQYHDTALNLAILKNLTSAVSFLLEVGADPDKYSGFKMRDKQSEPPLITAVRENQLSLGRLLLQSGCTMAARVPDVIADAATSQLPPLRSSASQPTAFRFAVEHECWQFAELLLDAGYDLKPEVYLWTNQDVPEQLVLNLDFWSRLLACVATPRSLVVCCRDVVRMQLGRKLQQKVAQLPLPSFLKEVLLLSGL